MFATGSIAVLAMALLSATASATAHPAPILMNLAADDNILELHVNGELQTLDATDPSATWADTASEYYHATRGETYTVAFKLSNDQNHVGAFFEAYDNGVSIGQMTAATTKCLANPPAGWEAADFDDSTWDTPTQYITSANQIDQVFTNGEGARVPNVGGALDFTEIGCRMTFTVPTTPADTTAVATCGAAAGRGTAHAIVGGNDKCLCHSGYGGSNCHHTKAARCDDIAESLTVDNSDAKITFADIYGQDLVVTTKFATIEQKKYNHIKVGNCDFDDFVVLDSQMDNSACQDVISVGVPVASLPNICGFEVTPDVTYGPDDKLHTLYRGAVTLDYTEPVSLGSVGTDFRDVEVVLPIDIYLQTEYTLPTIDDLKVYTDYDIKAAVTGQTIDPAGGKSTIELTYAVHFPYTVTDFNPVVRVDNSAFLQQGDIVVTTPVSEGQHLLEYDDYDNSQWVIKERTRLFYDLDVDQMTTETATDATDCQAIATAAGSDFFRFMEDISQCTHGKHADNIDNPVPIKEIADVDGQTSGILSQVGTYVLRTIELEFTHNGCELDGTYSLIDIDVYCAKHLPQVDCPLYEVQTGNEIQFTLDSENFCAGGGFSTVINDALEITEFIAVPKDNIVGAIEQQNAWLWGEMSYFRVTFVGLTIDRVDMMSLQTSAGGAIEFANGADFEDEALIANVGQMGLAFDEQRYYFEHLMSPDFAGPRPVEGVGSPLSVTATVNVGYFATAAPARRRRGISLRQEGTQEAGVGVVETQGAVSAPEVEEEVVEEVRSQGAPAIDDSSASVVVAGLCGVLAVMAF